jgi:ornithine cyclodeaminase/alanine dehydrogenase-like protein (mu-crystallin family)
MRIEIVDAATVRARLPMKDLIEAMAVAMSAASAKTVAIPPRTIVPLIDGSGYFGVMPGSVTSPRVYGAKVVSLYPANPAAGRPAIQGFVALFDPETGAPVALVDGAEITAMRTAAASALATRLLARPEARTLGLLGCGVQADSHLEAIALVRELEEVLVWGRSSEKARAFAERQARALGCQIRTVSSAEQAAACDVVCVVTGSCEPVIRGEWVRPGAHVNLVGAHTPTARESDTALVVRSRVYVDSLESALKEAGDILIPVQEGAIDLAHVIGEIGALLLGSLEGRRSHADVTVYKSLGLVIQDLIAAHAVVQKGKRSS